MSRTEPTQATYIAAELMAYAPPKWRTRPFRAAKLATDLCALGRAYKRLSERLCGGEEEWGPYPEAGVRIARAEKRRDGIERKARLLLAESPFSEAGIETAGLLMRVIHSRKGHVLESSVCL